MKHPKIKVYCKNCQNWTFAKTVAITRAIFGELKEHKVFGCAICTKPHLSPTGKFIEDYVILCRNYNVEWPGKLKDVQEAE